MVRAKIEVISTGTVTSPEGFTAGAIYAGIKKRAPTGLDMAILTADVPCCAAGVFTSNRIKAAPVLLSQEHLKAGKATAVVVNSGCANACTGDQGMADARETAALVAKELRLPPDEVLVASTGVIGQLLPMDLVRSAIGNIVLSRQGGYQFAKAIMTTDTVPKEVAVTVRAGDIRFTVGGVAKGAGMIHPNVATMLCFVTTDAAVTPAFVRQALRRAADVSFNLLTIDGDTSTNDTVLLLASARAGNQPISEGDELAEPFQQALEQVCVFLAKSIARDGEGATKLIEVAVNGAATEAEAAAAARTVAGSLLVKTAVHGRDPNWGRIVAAVGRSGVTIDEAKLSVFIDDICLFKRGRPLDFNREKVVSALGRKEVAIEVQLDQGAGSATAWGCDLSAEYVAINAEYTS